ncbi:MAG: hypothetical protein RIB46_09695 [Pseudomonadales bacterium]
MDTKRLALILIVGGTAVTAIAVVWFFTTYADAMEMASSFWGKEHVAKLMSCLYSSSPICEGAGMLGSGPSYSPAVFWIGVIAILAGVVVQFALVRRAGPAASSAAAADGNVPAASGEILSFIPPDQYARYSYILALCGAVAGLLIAPLAVVALAGLVLAVLGLSVYRAQVSAADVHHLGIVCVVLVGGGVLLFASRGTFLFLLSALAQIAALFVGFQAYRAGRLVNVRDLPGEVRLALKPGAPAAAERDSN